LHFEEFSAICGLSPKYYSMTKWSESRPLSNNPCYFYHALEIVLLALLTSRLIWDPFLVVNCMRRVLQKFDET
jgi:hypothetical protein